MIKTGESTVRIGYGTLEQEIPFRRSSNLVIIRITTH